MNRIHLLLFLVNIACVVSAQNVGIGTTLPAGKLHIKGNTDTSQLVIDANTTQGRIPLVRLRSAYGNDQLHIHADSSVNAFFGLNAGKKNTANLFVQGIYNTAIGSEAAQENVTGTNNTAVGYRSLFANTSSSNTAVGAWALTENTSGEYNTATGLFSLRNNVTGNNNTAAGYRALRSNTSGSNNTAFGHESLPANTTGSGNTAVGASALRNNDAFGNTAVGRLALTNNTFGISNTAVGADALENNTVGYDNVAIGWSALNNNVSGYRNIAIGALSGTASCCQFNNTISIGNNGYLNGWHNQVFLGNQNMTWNGGNVAWSTYSDARIKTNIKEEVKGLDFILRLRPVTYYRNVKAAMELTGNKDDLPDYPAKYDIEKVKFSGFLAQDVETAAKEVGYDFNGVQVPKNSNQLYSLSYESFVVPLVKAVQEQQQLIEELRAGLKVVQKHNAELLSKLEAMKTAK